MQDSSSSAMSQPCGRSWYILAFQAPLLPEWLLLSNDCEALDASARTGPTGMKTDGAITVEEVDRQGIHCQQQLQVPIDQQQLVHAGCVSLSPDTACTDDMCTVMTLPDCVTYLQCCNVL